LSAIDGTSRQAPSDSVVMFERIEIETKHIDEIAQLSAGVASGTGGTGGTGGTKNIVKVLKDVKFYTRKMTSFTRVWNTKKTKARCDGEKTNTFGMFGMFGMLVVCCMSNVKCQMSNVACQMSNVKC